MITYILNIENIGSTEAKLSDELRDSFAELINFAVMGVEIDDVMDMYTNPVKHCLCLRTECNKCTVHESVLAEIETIYPTIRNQVELNVPVHLEKELEKNVYEAYSIVDNNSIAIHT